MHISHVHVENQCGLVWIRFVKSIKMIGLINQICQDNKGRTARTSMDSSATVNHDH